MGCFRYTIREISGNHDRNNPSVFLRFSGQNANMEDVGRQKARKQSALAQDVSKLSLRERVDRTVAASENNRAMATQFHGVMKDGKMTFPNPDLAMKFLNAVNAFNGDNNPNIKFSLDNSEPLNSRLTIQNH